MLSPELVSSNTVINADVREPVSLGIEVVCEGVSDAVLFLLISA